MKKRNFKKVVAFVLTLAMVLSASGVFAMLTPPEETGLIKSDNYEGSSVTINFGTKTTLSDGNNVIAANQTQGGWKNTTVAANTDTPVDVVISFDAMAAQTTDAFQMFLRRTAADSTKNIGSVDFAGIEFSNDGTIRRNADGVGALNSVYGVQLATYEANKWYSIDLVVRGVAAKDYKTTVEYYINGVLVDTLDASAFGDFTHATTGLKYQSDAPVTTVFAGTDAGATGNMYFDNIKIYKADADSKYYAYADASTGKIDVEFSETPAGSMNSAVIKANDGTEIATTVSHQGRYMTVTYDELALNQGEEYALVLPDTMSVTGKELANNAVVFTTPGEAIVEVRYVAEYDFDDWTDADASLTAIGAAYGGSYELIPSTLVADKSGTGKALQLGYLGVGYTEGTNLTGFKNGTSSAYQYDKVSGLSEFITELDMKAPEAGQVTATNYVFAAGKKAALFIIDANGYFTASTHLSSSNNVQYKWDGVVKADGTYKDGFSEATHRVYKTTPGQWYNVKVGITPESGRVRYYLDNKLLAEYVNPAIASTSGAKVTELRIAANDFGADTVTHYTAIDNLKFGWSLGDTEVENATGKTFEAKDTNSTTGAWGMTNQYVNLFDLTDDTEEAKLGSGALVLSGDITLDTVDNNIMVFVTNPGNQLLTTIHVLDNGDVAIPSTATNTTGVANGAGDGIYGFTTTAEVTGVFKAGKATNVSVYIDEGRDYLYVFLNGLFAKKLSVTNLQAYTVESGGYKLLDTDKNGTVDDSELTPARLGVRMLDGTNNAGKIYIKNIKLMRTVKAPKIESIRLNSQDDEFSIHSADISYMLTSIDVNYDANVSAVPQVTLTRAASAGDVNVGLGTATYSGSTVNVPITDTYLPNGTYTLTVGDEKFSFVVNCELSIVINDFSVVDANGVEPEKFAANTPYYATASLYNPTAEEKSVTLILATYTDRILENVDFVKATLSAGGTLDIDKDASDAVTLTTSENTTEVCAFLWSDFENAIPYVARIELLK
ncbi:MAG: hypothetical protein ACI4DY_10640 [Monoglobaceae bacterium]